jgi:hypothetical protein
MLDLSEAKIREPLRPAPFRQDGAFQEGNAPYRAKRIATMVHEGMHFQPADRNVTGREGEGGRDHQGAFRQAVEDFIR